MEDNKPMIDSHLETIKKAWGTRHNFVFSSVRILAPLMMSKMHKHATASPKQFLVNYVDEMRLKGSLQKNETTSLTLRPGENPVATTADVEVVSGVVALRDKIEAQFNTWSFVSIQEPSWLCYQDVVDFMDIINEKFKLRYRGGARPPLNFFITTYTKTMAHFLEQVSVRERPLSAVMKETSAWINDWSSWDAPPAKNDGHSDTQAGFSAQMSKQMHNLSNMTSSLRNTLNQKKGQGKGVLKQQFSKPWQQQQIQHDQWDQGPKPNWSPPQPWKAPDNDKVDGGGKGDKGKGLKGKKGGKKGKKG